MQNIEALKNDLTDLETQPNPPNAVAVSNCKSTLQMMEDRQLEASYVVPTDNSGLAIVWTGEFHPLRFASIKFQGDGGVLAISHDRTQWAVRTWCISDLHQGDTSGMLKLPLDQSLEFIRQFLWSDND